MPEADDAPKGFVYAPRDQLRHDLNTPLTTILGRAQILERTIWRSPSLTEQEKAGMLAGVIAIETAGRTMCAVVDAIGDEDRGP